MKTINTPDWYAMTESPRVASDDALTLSEVREARHAVIHAFHFLRQHGDQQAHEHVQGLARAWSVLGGTVFRLSGSDI